MTIDPFEEGRCKHYETTLTSCKCKGFSFRKTCRHTDYLRRRQQERGELTEGQIHQMIEFAKGNNDAVRFVEMFSENTFDVMKQKGYLYERHGRVYQL